MRHVRTAGPILLLAVLAVVLLAVGLDQDESTPSSASAAPTPVHGGCGTTTAYRGRSPAWTASAQVPRGIHALGDEGNLAAFLWARPLRAGHPQNPANKILWVVRLPRDGQSLGISGHPRGSPGPTVKYTLPANSGPGEIYPSTIDVPTPGCWTFTLRWGAHTDQLGLAYAHSKSRPK